MEATRELSLVTWSDVRGDVYKVNKELANIIDEISPDSSYKLVKAKYLYGDLFVKDGELYLPIKNKLTAVSDRSIDNCLKKELTYSRMPLLLLLEKSSEVFTDTASRIIPINLFHKGSLTGTYETMDYLTGKKSDLIWTLSAGSRSILMLPKITDKLGLQKLRMTYDIPIDLQIKSLENHWELFKHIAQSSSFTQKWQNSVLCFGEKWFSNNKNSDVWSKFKTYLLSKIWEQAIYSINKLKFNLCWESFAEAISLRRLQPKPYLINQVKHLLSIVAGDYPVFKPIDNSQEAAPTMGLQKAFMEIYGLKNYYPFIMHARFIDDTTVKPTYGYYSLALPTILDGSPLKKTSATILNDMRSIKLLMETLKGSLRKKINIEGVNSLVKNAEIDYFHYEEDICKEILSSKQIFAEDKAFLAQFPKVNKELLAQQFCPTSPFFSGCIRISAKE